jgi:hypothetical protein
VAYSGLVDCLAAARSLSSGRPCDRPRSYRLEREQLAASHDALGLAALDDVGAAGPGAWDQPAKGVVLSQQVQRLERSVGSVRAASSE